MCLTIGGLSELLQLIRIIAGTASDSEESDVHPTGGQILAMGDLRRPRNRNIEHQVKLKLAWLILRMEAILSSRLAGTTSQQQANRID